MTDTFKPKFWKPGSEISGWQQERNTDETELTSVIYNPHCSVSLEQQRQRLPIFKNRNHILYLLEIKQTLVLVGETGCGKSTQVPQYLLEAGWTRDKKVIGISQPRRVAATTLASRVAEERGCILGEDVGYSIRFDDCYDPNRTKIKYMTEGILVREMMGDPLLNNYTVLMLDEVHERTLYSDVILGLMKKILKKRSDLHLVVSSATMDAESLKDFFNLNETGDCSEDTSVILGVEGRTFPVDVHYLLTPVPNYVTSCVETAIKIHEREQQGGILIFLTGQEEVDTATSQLIEYARNLKDRQGMKMVVMPMYGALPASDQLRVFQRLPRGVRKVVVATNIAEASITIHGVVYVVDSGFVKMRYFNARTGMDSLVVVSISKASARQRTGRAGRAMSGKSYRLYTEEDFDKLDEHTPPEIQRSNLAPIILQLKALGISNILRFNFPAAPPSENVVSGLELLFALGTLDEAGNLVDPLGIQMSEFPLQPMFAKMLLVSGVMGCSEEALTVVAMLQVQNIFVSPPNRTAQARKCKYQFSVEEGDHLTLLNVFSTFLKFSKSKRWCEDNYLNYKGLTRALEIRTQLIKMLKKFKVPLVSSEGDADTILRCIVAGFFANAAYLHPSGIYKTIRGEHQLHIHPSSVLYTQKQPQWVVFNEVLHTSMEYMRDISVVEPSWLYELAPQYYRFGTAMELHRQENYGNAS